jgi:hypothetical protein
MLGSAVALGEFAASQEIDWKSYRETGPDNTVFGSTSNGGSVLLGKMTVRMTLKSWTIIEGDKMKGMECDRFRRVKFSTRSF